MLDCDDVALTADGKALEGDVDVLKGVSCALAGVLLKSKVKH